MAIAIAHSAQTASAAASTLTVTNPSAGDILVAFVAQNGTNAKPTGGDNATGLGWTTVTTFAEYNTSSGASIYAMTKEVTATDVSDGLTSLTPTVGSGGTIEGICYWDLTGASTLVDAAVATNNTTSVSTLASGALTTHNSGSIILVGVGLPAASGTISAWTSTVLTNIGTASSRCFGGSLIPGTTESGITPTANWATAGKAGMLALALKPPGSGSPGQFFPVFP